MTYPDRPWHAPARLLRSATWLTMLSVSIGLAAAQSADVPEGEDERSAARATENPRLVEEVVAGNIFRADRGEPDEPEPEPEQEQASDDEPEEPTPPPDPDASRVLVGVVIRDDAAYAFVEDRQTGAVERFEAPGPCGRGEIVEIHVDGIVYRVDGSQWSVQVQQTFTGDEPQRLAGNGSSRREFTTEDTGGASRDRGSQDSSDTRAAQREAILERMRQRRQQQTSPNPSPRE